MTTAVGIVLCGCSTQGAVEIAPFTQSDKADGLAQELTLLDHHKLHVDEPSDLAFFAGALYTVSDRNSNIYRIDDDGDVKDELSVRGKDLEALAIDNEGRFYIGDEEAGAVWRLAEDGAREDKFEIDGTRDGNSGIEGLAFDDRGFMYVAKEKSPSRIITLTEAGEQVASEKVNFSDDLSALAFNADDGHLYALSDEDHSLYRLDSDFAPITAWRLPIKHPEGLAFDGATVYVASDSERRLYVLELE